MKRNPEGLTTPETLPADAGYCSKQNVGYCVERGIEPLISIGREQHTIPLLERCGGDSEPVSRTKEAAYPTESDSGQTADTSMDRMKARLKTAGGRAEYGKRKGVVEPVFGIIKEVLNFRRFLLRGLKKAKGEWTLACMAYNVKRMHIIRTS